MNIKNIFYKARLLHLSLLLLHPVLLHGETTTAVNSYLSSTFQEKDLKTAAQAAQSAITAGTNSEAAALKALPTTIDPSIASSIKALTEERVKILTQEANGIITAKTQESHPNRGSAIFIEATGKQAQIAIESLENKAAALITAKIGRAANAGKSATAADAGLKATAATAANDTITIKEATPDNDKIVQAQTSALSQIENAFSAIKKTVKNPPANTDKVIAIAKTGVSDRISAISTEATTYLAQRREEATGNIAALQSGFDPAALATIEIKLETDMASADMKTKTASALLDIETEVAYTIVHLQQLLDQP
jgi:hypothetical protein